MILIVDDNFRSRRLIAQLLEAEEYGVTEVATGLGAMRYLAGHTPRLIIYEYRLPDLGGLALLKVIRDDARLKDIPVMIYGSEDSPSLVAESKRMGAQAYLVKRSYRWDLFLNEVDQCLGAHARKRREGVETETHGSDRVYP